MGIFSRKKNIKRAQPLNQSNIVTSDVPFSSIVGGSGFSFILDRYITDPETLSAFFGGVELISNSIANVPIFVKDLNSLEINKKHPVIQALGSGRLSKFNLIKQLVHDIYIEGNGVAYIQRGVDGEVKELIYCKPGDYNIFVDQKENKVYYTFPKITGTKYLDRSNVIHLFKNSKDGLTGQPISKYARITVPLSASADRSALQFYDSGGNISGILQSPKHLDTEEKIEAYNEWNNAFRGNEKNGNIVVLGNDFEYKTVGISQKDAQQLETRQFNVSEICRYLQVNPVLLGINTGSAYNNVEQAQLDLVIRTLLPLIELIEEEFNRKLIRPSQRDRYVIDFDEDKIMFTDKTSTANYLMNLVKNGIMTINEARKSLGLKEVENGDLNIIPYTDINQNSLQKAKENEENQEKQPEEQNEDDDKGAEGAEE